MIRALILMLGLALALPAQAEQVVAGLSQNRVSINTNFDGSEILVFGAVKRETAIPLEPQLEVIVTVSGPSRPVTVRRKDRRFGIWVNTDALEVARAPSFYAVATTAPMASSISAEADEEHGVTIPRAIRADASPDPAIERDRFVEALIRIRADQGLYQTLIGAVDLTEDTLFKTSIALPANLTEGNYLARILLTRGGEVIDSHQTVIFVQKVGLEWFLYSLAHERPLIYGLMSLAIAIAAGWAASAVFRYIRA